MEYKRPQNSDVEIANARSRQRMSEDIRASNCGPEEAARLSRERFYVERSERGVEYSSKEIPERQRAPWAFDIIDEFAERINHGNKDAKVHLHIEFIQFEKMRGPKKTDDYIGGFLSATLHLGAEPELPREDANKWKDDIAESIVRNSNGFVSKYTGIRKPYHQKGMIVDFRLEFGISPMEQNASESWKNIYQPTEKKKEEIGQVLKSIEQAIDMYNNRVSKSSIRQEGDGLSGLVRS